GEFNIGRTRPRPWLVVRYAEPLSHHNAGGDIHPSQFFGCFFICFWMLAASKCIDGGIKLLLGHAVLGHEPCTRCVECRGCAAYRITVAQGCADPRTSSLPSLLCAPSTSDR